MSPSNRNPFKNLSKEALAKFNAGEREALVYHILFVRNQKQWLREINERRRLNIGSYLPLHQRLLNFLVNLIFGKPRLPGCKIQFK